MMLRRKVKKPEGDRFKPCAQCNNIIIRKGEADHIWKAKTYCSPECRRQSAIDKRRGSDPRFTIDREDAEEIDRLADLVGCSRYDLNRKMIKLVLMLFERDKISLEQLKKIKTSTPKKGT